MKHEKVGRPPSPLTPFNIAVTFEQRGDGGLRAYSDMVPGFVLSHSDPAAVMADVGPVLEVILSEMLGTAVKVQRLPDVDKLLRDDGEPAMPAHLCHQNYFGAPAVQ